jgi:hypothetical protein
MRLGFPLRQWCSYDAYDKYANVFLIYAKRWNSSIDSELGSASTKSPNLSWGKAHPLEQQGAAVALD